MVKNDVQKYPAAGYSRAVTRDPGGVNAVTQFSYDSYGNIAAVTDAENRTTGFRYNELNKKVLWNFEWVTSVNLGLKDRLNVTRLSELAIYRSVNMWKNSHFLMFSHIFTGSTTAGLKALTHLKLQRGNKKR